LDITENLTKWISKQRKITKTIEWNHPDSLFKDASQGDSSDIFDEVQLTVLIVYYHSYSENGRKDLIIFYPKFAEDALFTSSEKFLPDDKKTVACLMEKAVKTTLSREYEIHTLMGEIDEHYKNAKSFWTYTKSEQYQTKGKQLDYANHILKELGKKHGIQVSLSKEAEQIIINFEGELHQIEHELTTAVKIALNISSCPTGSIELDDFLLISLLTKKNYEDGKKTSSNKSFSSSSTSDIDKESRKNLHGKTEHFLNRLEMAVKVTIENDEKVTGINVGAYMKPEKISAPAISDSIYRYHDCIVTLMAREPARWPLLRRYFRPIQNVIDYSK
jgi:hypothetical protein